MFGDGVAGEEATERGRVVAEVVVDEVEFGVVMLRGPLEGLGDVAGFRYVPERSVGIRRADVAGGTEDFADVFREVVAVGEPRAVFLDRERTRRRRLRRIPGNEPQRRMTGTRAIHAGNLQISAIDVAVVKRYRSRDRYFFEVTPTLRIAIYFINPQIHRVLLESFSKALNGGLIHPMSLNVFLSGHPNIVRCNWICIGAFFEKTNHAKFHKAPEQTLHRLL